MKIIDLKLLLYYYIFLIKKNWSLTKKTPAKIIKVGKKTILYNLW